LGGQQQQQNSNRIQEKTGKGAGNSSGARSDGPDRQPGGGDRRHGHPEPAARRRLAELSPQKTDFDTSTSDFILQPAEYHKKDRHTVLYSQLKTSRHNTSDGMLV
jgi:hypothetical protein